METNTHTHSHSGKWRGILAGTLSVLVLTAAAFAGGSAFAANEDDDTVLNLADTETASNLSTGSSTASQIYENAVEQVVGITSDITMNNIFGQAAEASVSGSGIIITEDGYILTNYHVIEDAQASGSEIRVITYDDTEYTAEVIGYDESNDIAVLKIDASGLSAAVIGDSDDLVVGQTIYAVGNPLGELTFTMTSGIVSATNRVINTESNVSVNMFQIDAAVNEGNSGGPVYNEDGQVVGIVTAKYSSAGVEGLGFAIPINDAAHIAEELIDNGYVSDRASMGISCTTVTSDVANTFNMTEGAFVNSINEGSAAEAAGLEESDIITAIDGTPITSSSELAAAVKGYYAGDTAELTVVRDGEELTLTITFDEKEADTEDDTAAAETPEAQQSESGTVGNPFGSNNGGQYFNFGY